MRGTDEAIGSLFSYADLEARVPARHPLRKIRQVVNDALMENRSGLIVQGDLTQANGHAERRAALEMIHLHSPGSTRRLTLGADKGFDAAEFVVDLRQACVTPHVAQKSRYSAIDGRTTRHKVYTLSIKHRKRIEEAFGWTKTVGGMTQTVYRGLERVRSRFILTMTSLPEKPSLHMLGARRQGISTAFATRPWLARRASFSLFLSDGRVAIDDNPAERALHPIGIDRKSWLFASAGTGGETLARAMTIIETEKLNCLYPQAYLADVLDRIHDHKINLLDEPLPWNWTQSAANQAEAA